MFSYLMALKSEYLLNVNKSDACIFFYFYFLFSSLYMSLPLIYNCCSVSIQEEVLQARCHYSQAVIDGCIFKLYDDAYVKVICFCSFFLTLSISLCGSYVLVLQS